MSQDTNIEDGYEENPWDDEDGKNIKIVEDFLPSPKAFENATVRFISEEKDFYKSDLQIIERLALEKNVTPEAFIAGILHDFATGQLVKRSE